MKYFFIFAMASYCALNATSIPQKFDNISNLSNNLFLSVLDQTVKIKSNSYTNLPPSLSFFSADTKFDGEHLKFCELGNGLYGVIYPVYGLLKNEKAILYPPYWEFLWLYASQFNIPMWCITYKKTNMAYKTLQQLGGKIFNNIEEFEKYLETTYLQEKFITKKPNSIEAHIGMLAYNGPRIENSKLEEFKARHPGILFINDFPSLYQRRKDEIHKIFDDEFLSQFRPRWGVYPAKYSATLSEQIKREIKSQFYIIKPLVGRQSRGIVLVNGKDLDSTLKTILKKPIKNYRNQKKKGSSFEWKDYEFDKFIVEEFIESKQILKNGQPYDPTLRLGFIISQNNGEISVNVINAFWKFPPQSLNADCDPAAKHITKSLIGIKEPALNADAADLKKIREILNAMLPKLYEKYLISEERK